MLTTIVVAGQGKVDSPGVMTPAGAVPALGSYKVPKMPWGEPNIQGTYNANDLQVPRGPDKIHPTRKGFETWTELIWNWYAGLG